jgi:hypothetical protein
MLALRCCCLLGVIVLLFRQLHNSSVTMSGIPMSKGTPVRTQYWRSTRALEQCEEDPQSARVTEDKCGAIAYQLCIELPGSPSSLMILMTL